jgi:hypothetical protein
LAKPIGQTNTFVTPLGDWSVGVDAGVGSLVVVGVKVPVLSRWVWRLMGLGVRLAAWMALFQRP